MMCAFRRYQCFHVAEEFASCSHRLMVLPCWPPGFVGRHAICDTPSYNQADCGCGHKCYSAAAVLIDFMDHAPSWICHISRPMVKVEVSFKSSGFSRGKRENWRACEPNGCKCVGDSILRKAELGSRSLPRERAAPLFR